MRVEEIDDLGSGVIVVVVEQVAHRTRGGAVIRLRSAPVFLWAESLIVQLTLYPDIDEARPAAERLAEERG